MDDSWIPMMRQYEHGPGAIMINTRYRDQGPCPDPSRPSASVIVVKFNQPDQSGMGTDEDAASIDDAWDAIATHLTADLHAEFVSRLRYHGEARILIYSPSASRSAIDVAAGRAFPKHTVRVEHHSDSEWSKYRSALPTPSEERYVLDTLVVDALRQHGDPLTPKRDVRHHAYFPARAAADSFAKQISQQGFKVEVEPSDDQWLVTAARDHAVDHPQISTITGPLADLAASLGGEYDGWEAMLVRKKGLLGKLFKR